MEEEEKQKINNQLRDFNAYVDAQKAMNTVIYQMREVPVYQSEIPQTVEKNGTLTIDRDVLKRVEFPDSGGVLTYMGDYPLPYKGFPYFEFVEKMDIVKKVSRGVLSGFYHYTYKRPWIQKIFLLPAIWIFKDLIYSEVNGFHRFVSRFLIKPIRYSQAVREIHWAFSIEQPGEDEETRTLRMQFRDLLCMHLELDNAYRYRFQDVFPEINKIELSKDPIKEIKRLFDVMISREKTQEIKDSWILTKLYLDYYLRFDRKVKKSLSFILSKMDADVIALDDGDKQFAFPRKDYNFKFSN